MDQHDNEHAAYGHGGGPLAEPSVWGILSGLSALILGLVLVWWKRDTSDDLAQAVLGASIVATIIAVVAWARESLRLRHRAEAHTAGEARFTQVITLGVAEGQLDIARGESGIIAELEQAESALRGLAGFEDLRVILSPAAVGQSQVLVETTWSNREGLATYEETHRTVLDLIDRHQTEVVPGSVQVFDMEVVRDTKDISYRFGLPAAATVVGALVIAGFAVGAGLATFEKETKAAAGETPTPTGGPDLIATDNKFNKSTLQAPPNTDISVTWENRGKVKHNLHFYDQKGGKTLADGAGSDSVFFDGGQSETLKFKTPAAGNYYFQCDLHPTEMFGTFVVKEGVPAPGQTSDGAATGASFTVTATDNKFDKTSLTAKAGEAISVTMPNKGKVKHNIHFYDKAGGKTLVEGAGSDSEFFDPGQTQTLKFTVANAGKYYFQCDLHPTEMKGTLTVT